MDEPATGARWIVRVGSSTGSDRGATRARQRVVQSQERGGVTRRGVQRGLRQFATAQLFLVPIVCGLRFREDVGRARDQNRGKGCGARRTSNRWKVGARRTGKGVQGVGQ